MIELDGAILEAINPDEELNLEEGEYNSICSIRDFILHLNPKMKPEDAEQLARFYCNYIHKCEGMGADMDLNKVTVYCLLKHVTSQGMTRVISFYTISNNNLNNIDWFISAILGYKRHKKYDGVVVKGCGMDMGFHVIYSLSRKLYGDGYCFTHRWM